MNPIYLTDSELEIVRELVSFEATLSRSCNDTELRGRLANYLLSEYPDLDQRNTVLTHLLNKLYSDEAESEQELIQDDCGAEIDFHDLDYGM